MLPGIDTGGGGFSGSSGATSGSDGSIGDRFSTSGGGFLNSSGIKFGSKGIDTTMIAVLGVIVVGALYVLKK